MAFDPDEYLASESATATTFADPGDVAAFRAAKARGLSDQEALAVGDNGVGKWGDDTTRSDDPIVALPRDLPGVAHNRLVKVSGPEGEVIARVADVMPKRENITNGAGIDLNPAAAAAVGATSGKASVNWRFIDTPDAGGFDPDAYLSGKSQPLRAQPVSAGGFDPDAYMKEQGISTPNDTPPSDRYPDGTRILPTPTPEENAQIAKEEAERRVGLRPMGVPPRPEASRIAAVNARDKLQSTAEQLGVDHFIGSPNEPEGDRAPTMDMEGIVAELKRREQSSNDPALAKQRAYWENEISTHGMSAERWKQQTGEDDPLYPTPLPPSSVPETEKAAAEAPAKPATGTVENLANVVRSEVRQAVGTTAEGFALAGAQANETDPSVMLAPASGGGLASEKLADFERQITDKRAALDSLQKVATDHFGGTMPADLARQGETIAQEIKGLEAAKGIIAPRAQEMDAALKEQRAQSAGDAEALKADVQSSDARFGVDPARNDTAAVQATRGVTRGALMAGEAMMPVIGLPLMATTGASQTYAQEKNNGASDADAESSAVRSMIGLAIFGGASKVAAAGLAEIIPEGAGAVRTFVTQLIGQDAANEVTSRALSAWEASEKAKPGEKLNKAYAAALHNDIGSMAQNLGFAGMGALHATGARPAESATAEPDISAEPGAQANLATALEKDEPTVNATNPEPSLSTPRETPVESSRPIPATDTAPVGETTQGEAAASDLTAADVQRQAVKEAVVNDRHPVDEEIATKNAWQVPAGLAEWNERIEQGKKPVISMTDRNGEPVMLNELGKAKGDGLGDVQLTPITGDEIDHGGTQHIPDKRYESPEAALADAVGRGMQLDESLQNKQDAFRDVGDSPQLQPVDQRYGGPQNGGTPAEEARGGVGPAEEAARPAEEPSPGDGSDTGLRGDSSDAASGGVADGGSERDAADGSSRDSGGTELADGAQATAPASTGIANRVLDAEVKAGRIDSVDSGEGMSWKDMVDWGRKQMNEGADPQMIARRFQRNGRISPDDFAVIRAERERLAVETNKAEEAARANPENPELAQDHNDARKAETEWIQKVVQPAKTATSDIFRGMQGEAPIDASTFARLRRAVLDEKGRDVKPAEVGTLRRAADRVQQATAREAKAKEQLDNVLTSKTAGRIPVSAETLRAHFAERVRKLTPCD